MPIFRVNAVYMISNTLLMRNIIVIIIIIIIIIAKCPSVRFSCFEMRVVYKHVTFHAYFKSRLAPVSSD